MAENDRDFLLLYLETIKTLREKHYSYRQIAEWFSEKGITSDHNAIYRCVKKHVKTSS